MLAAVICKSKYCIGAIHKECKTEQEAQEFIDAHKNWKCDEHKFIKKERTYGVATTQDKSRAADMTRQRTRDRDALTGWIAAGCPPPPALYRTVWQSKDKTAPTVMFWIRSEFGKEE